MYHDEKYCKNCGQHLILDQKFCHSCGQKSDTHRINLHFLVHEIQHGIFHVDKGIFYTLKELFTRPGHSIREYLEGRRQKHFKPVLLIMILGAVIVLLNKMMFHDTSLIGKIDERIIFKKEKNIDGSDANGLKALQAIVDTFKNAFEWINEHFAITMLFMIPFYAVALYIGFFKRNKTKRYNLAEYLVVATFLTAQCMVVFILFLPFKNNTEIFSFLNFAMLVINFWALTQLFKDYPKFKTFLRYSFAVFIFSFFLILIITIGLSLNLIELINDGVIKRD